MNNKDSPFIEKLSAWMDVKVQREPHTKINQTWLAKECGVSAWCVCRWFKENTPSRSNMAKIYKAFGVTKEEFWNGPVTEKKKTTTIEAVIMNSRHAVCEQCEAPRRQCRMCPLDEFFAVLLGVLQGGDGAMIAKEAHERSVLSLNSINEKYDETINCYNL